MHRHFQFVLESLLGILLHLFGFYRLKLSGVLMVLTLQTPYIRYLCGADDFR